MTADQTAGSAARPLRLPAASPGAEALRQCYLNGGKDCVVTEIQLVQPHKRAEFVRLLDKHAPGTKVVWVPIENDLEKANRNCRRPQSKDQRVRQTIIIAPHGSGSTATGGILTRRCRRLGRNRSSPSMAKVRRPAANIPSGGSGGRAIRLRSGSTSSKISLSARVFRSWPWSGSSIRIAS